MRYSSALIIVLAVVVVLFPAMAEGQSLDAVTKQQKTDVSLQERMQYLGLIIPEEVKQRFEEIDRQPPPALLNTEEYFDWRTTGGVTPVKDQGQCGSCWDFAATAAFESAILINGQIELDLSEQQVLSCNTGGSSCGGGWMEDAYSLFMSYGAVAEACMPYEANDNVPCTQEDCDPLAWMTGYVDIPNNVTAIKNAVTISPVSTTFMVYSDFSWNCYWHEDTGDLNHAVLIVGWDDDMCGGQGAWIVKNSWGTDWGDDGYFYMPYGSCGIGRYTQRPYFGNVAYLRFDYPDGLPAFVDRHDDVSIRVEVGSLAGTPQPGTGMFHYNLGYGWIDEYMEIVAPNVYDALFPQADCGIEVPYYFSAEEVGGQANNDPPLAPDNAYSALIADEVVVLFEDDFETNQGWTVENSCADGQWERGDPVGWDRGDPPDDYDGSGQCYLTDNDHYDENCDVDDGYTWLISPAFDLSESDAVVQYALWYTNNFGNDPNNDLFKVYVSSDDGDNWTLAETFGPVTTGGWNEKSFIVGNYVTPTNQVRVRFEASDLNDGSVVEAGVDAFSVKSFGCLGSNCVYVPGDCNHNGVALELGDVVMMIGMYRGSSEVQYTCPCPPQGDEFAAEADLDGNCVPMQLGDVVTEIGAYRGTNQASSCPDCPGSLRLIPDENNQPLVAPR
jgi:C1A family cysteine protease